MTGDAKLWVGMARKIGDNIYTLRANAQVDCRRGATFEAPILDCGGAVCGAGIWTGAEVAEAYRLQTEARDARERESKQKPVLQTDQQLLARYRACAYRIFELFGERDPLDDYDVQFATDRLEALLDQGMLLPKPAKPVEPELPPLPERLSAQIQMHPATYGITKADADAVVSELMPLIRREQAKRAKGG
jgi:hypothetical protein